MSNLPALVPQPAPARPTDQTGTALATAQTFALGELESMANYLAASRLLPGVEDKATAFTLMMLCQSQGLHPFEAMRRYHIVEGRPAMRSDAMQAEFQRRGGVVRIIRKDSEEARAHLSHPTLLPHGHDFSYTYAEAKASGITQGKQGEKTNWRSHRPDMLWARMVTKAIRTIYPGIVAGIYSPEELEDAKAAESPAAQIEHQRQEAAAVVAAAEIQLPGQTMPGHDPRPYVAVAAAAAAAFESDPWPLHAHLATEAIGAGKITGPLGKRAVAIKALSDLYRTDRDWIRSEIQRWCEGRYVEATVTVTPAPSTPPPPEPEPAPEPEPGTPFDPEEADRPDYDPGPDEDDIPY